MEGQVAIVTGGSGTIGKAIAKDLLQAGATVVITGRTQSTLDAARAELLGGGGSAPDEKLHVYVMDVAKEDDVVGLFEHVQKTLGTCNLLVNNAGMAVAGPIETLSGQDMDRVLTVNVTGPFLCAREFFKQFQNETAQARAFVEPRRIINIGSIAAIAPRPHSAPYTASKFGMLGLHQCLSVDGRPLGIGVGIIHPGNVPSNLYSPEVIAAREPLEGFCTPADIAACCLTMALLPPTSNVHELTVQPTKQPLIGRG